MYKNDDEFSIDEITNVLVAIDNFDSSDTNVRISLDLYRHFIGRTGTMYLSSGINRHACYFDDYKRDDETDEYIIGDHDRQITLQDILNVLKQMKNQKFEIGRTYFYEGIEELSNDFFRIMWGS